MPGPPTSKVQPKRVSPAVKKAIAQRAMQVRPAAEQGGARTSGMLSDTRASMQQTARNYQARMQDLMSRVSATTRNVVSGVGRLISGPGPYLIREAGDRVGRETRPSERQ